MTPIGYEANVFPAFIQYAHNIPDTKQNAQ